MCRIAAWTLQGPELMVPESVDLAALAERLGRQAPSSAISGYLAGKTWFRDAVVSDLGCSELEAETIVDTLVNRGFLTYSGDPRSASPLGVWRTSVVSRLRGRDVK
jgi:hypothetical protein